MRKISANYIFDGYKFLKNAIVKIDDSDKIIELIDTKGNLTEAEGIEFYNGIITPGFINAHCHLELSHLKGAIQQGIGLHNFVRAVSNLRTSTAEEIAQAIEQADFFMQHNGIVAVGDISNTTNSFETKCLSKINYHTFFEIFDLFDEHRFESEWKATEQRFNNFATNNRATIVAHAPYTCSNRLLDKIAEHSKIGDCLTIHNQEAPSEDEMFMSQNGTLFDFLSAGNSSFVNFKKSGKSSCQTIIEHFATNRQYIFVHNTHSHLADIECAEKLLGKENCYWCLCPQSNYFIEKAQPNYQMFMKNKSNIVLGTDGLSSNTNLSIVEELKLIACQQPNISLKDTLQWATINGAKALKMDEKLGSISQGKQPGINLLELADLRNLQATPQMTVRKLV